MKKGVLHVFNFSGAPRELIERLLETQRDWFDQHFADVTFLHEDLPLPENAYDVKRSQYKARPFLKTLDIYTDHSTHALGLVNLDLFVPDLNFIFGTAQFGGNAVVALPRLRQSFYGLPDDDSLFFQRTVKEVFHELGHVLGLRHCTDHCVMQFSNSLSDTDRKPDSFCQGCLLLLEEGGRVSF
ncbi:MAG: archaemetzincin family Zn-dependent metalloprotease [Candidatus Thorarchaeota archaeon]